LIGTPIMVYYPGHFITRMLRKSRSVFYRKEYRQFRSIVTDSANFIKPRYFYKSIMKITFYHSFLCPRCHTSRRILLGITRHNPDMEIEEIDILAHPLKTWSDGIRLFPALKIGDRICCGVFLNKEKMETFINESSSLVKD
jgi:hypothetical protein